MARKRVPRSFQNGEYAGEDGAAAAGHNSESAIIKDPAERAALIESTVREVALLESERKELDERIRALKSANIKGRLGLKIGDFNATFRLSGKLIEADAVRVSSSAHSAVGEDQRLGSDAARPW